MSKIRLLWYGDSPAVTTGFGRVSQSVLERLYKTGNYDIYVLGINHVIGDPHRYEGRFKIFPAKARGNVYGLDRVEEVINKVKPQIIIMNNDLWIVSEIAKILPAGQKVISYSPVDALPVNKRWIELIDKVGIRLVAYTNFARDGILECNVEQDVPIIGHGVDIDEFYPIDDARKFLPNLPQDSFVVQNVNRNQPRKRLDLYLQACALWLSRKSKKERKKIYVYYHGVIKDVGWDLINLSERFGVRENFLLTDQNNFSVPEGLPISVLCKIYNCADIHVNTSMGEGFGLSNFESAACGIAQVVPNSSACKELWEGVAPLIDIDHYDVLTGGINTEGAVINIEHLAGILDDLYINRGKLNGTARGCYKQSQEEAFTWEYVASQFDYIIRDTIENFKPTEKIKEG